MEAIFTPYKNALHQMGEQFIAAQKQMADWQRAQLKVAEEQTVAGLRASKASFDAGVEFNQNVTKTLVNALAPKAESASA